MLTKTTQWTRAALASITSLALWTGWALAQDPSGGGDVTTTTRTSTSTTLWYGQWWVWAVGLAVFLIVIVALTNRGSRSA